jgi:hypothetical protein
MIVVFFFSQLEDANWRRNQKKVGVRIPASPPLFEDTLLRLLQHLDHAASQLRHLSDLCVDHSPRVRREKRVWRKET